jgi:hypothetical protein
MQTFIDLFFYGKGLLHAPYAGRIILFSIKNQYFLLKYSIATIVDTTKIRKTCHPIQKIVVSTMQHVSPKKSWTTKDVESTRK